jgi:hypothetical protein
MTLDSRRLVAGSLVTTALLSTLWTLTEPDLSGDHEAWLGAIADAGDRARLSALAFVLAQLPFMVGMAGLARWLQPSRLAVVGGVLTVLGGFGHAVYGGVVLTQTVMAQDRSNLTVFARFLEQLETEPALLPFMVLGLLGTVLGVLLLSLAWWRSRTAPRWVAPALWAFLVVEFVGTNISHWAAYLALLLYLTALGAVAARLVAEPAPVPAPATAD